MPGTSCLSQSTDHQYVITSCIVEESPLISYEDVPQEVKFLLFSTAFQLQVFDSSDGSTRTDSIGYAEIVMCALGGRA
jgi:hypothetical protein